MNKRAHRRTALRAKHVAIAVAAAFAPWAHGQTPPPPNTLPTGGVITQGTGTINAPVHAPGLSTLQIDQTSARMAAQFGSFSIGQSAHVNVSQPTTSSVALFKDVGGSLSQIYGGLTANGHIFISNQNGVLFGSTARVEVGGLFATNLSINETEFMEGRYNWYNDGATGTVTNQGTIITPSGYTVLAGPQVRNDGIIIARSGTVVLAAGDRVALDLIGDGLISVSVDQAALNASAINAGTINAEGGTVMLTARSANALLDTVVNSGVIRATALIERNGEVILDAGPGGTVYATGETQATQVSVRGGGLHVERLVPDPMLLNGMIAGDTINVDVTDAVLVERGGQIMSRFGQSITAGSLTIRAQQPGEVSTVRNETGNQAITVTGADGILVEATNGGSAILGKPFIFGVPATDSQTISATRIHVQGGSIQANEQNITVSGDFSLHNGTAITLGGNQTITVTNGNVDLRDASLSSGAAQSINVTGGDHISVVGEAGFAGLQASFGPQTVSITGTGANAIRLGSASATGQSTVNGLSQTITAGNAGESGSITITGSNGSGGATHFANIGVGVANPQIVRTSGMLSVTGGTASPGRGAAGIFQNNPAEQRISAANVVLQGGSSGPGNGAFINSTFGGGQVFDVPGEVRVSGGAGGAAGIFNGTNTPLPGTNTPQTNSAPQTINAGSVVLQGGIGGSGNTAFINSSFGGNQTLTVPGEIRVTGGDGGTNNRAGIITNANQTINGNPNIFLAGGNGGAGNNVFIQATGDDTKVQTVNARRVQLNAGLGTDASATFNAARQVMTTMGDVSLFGSGGGGSTNGVRIGGIGGSTLGPTNLTLGVGGDLLLHGGSANSANLGSSGPSTQSNNITVVASGNVILKSDGADARIGTSNLVPVTPGNITVTAAGSLQLDSGTAIRTNGPITLTANSFTNAGTITNGGGTNSANMVFNADNISLAGGHVTAGSAAVILRPRTSTNTFEIESAGATPAGSVTRLGNADIASIQTDNFVVFGSGLGSFTGNMIIGQNARVEGAGRNLSFLRTGAGTSIIGAHGVGTTGDVIISSNGGSIASNGGIVAGDEVQLRATLGIGAAGASVNTDANALSIVNSSFGVPPIVGGNAFVSEANDVTLRNTTLIVGGMSNNANNFVSGSLDFSAAGNVTVAGTVESIGPMNVNTGGALTLAAAGSQDAILRGNNGGQTIDAQSVNITAQNGRVAQIVNSGGNQTVTASAIDIRTQAGGGTAEIRNNSVGEQTLNVAGGSITLRGADSGVGRASIFSGGNQTINGNPDLFLTGGGTGITGAGNDARIETALGTARQTINAGRIVLSNSELANANTFAGFNSSHQVITTTGDVIMSSGTGAHPGAVRMQGGNGATDLKLNVGGSLLITGGTAPGGGAGLGSSNVSNNIAVVATGDVILNSGANGARIGSSSDGTVGGDISITARNIELNGTASTAAIRTLETVTLNAVNISEVGRGTIIAGTLNTHSSGSTVLTGMDAGSNITNAVLRFNGVSGGDLRFFNRGPLTVTGLNAAGDASVVNALADLNVTGQWTSSTASIFSGAAIVETGAGAIQAASLVTDAPLGVNLAGANRVGVLDARTSGVLTFNNVEALEVARASASNGANLTSAGMMTISGPVISSNSINLTANGGSIVETGSGSITTGFGSLSTFSTGDTILNGSQNQIGSFNALSGGDVSLVNNGFLNVTGMNAAGDIAITTFGATISGPWTAGGTSTITAGDIVLNGSLTSPHVVLNSGAGSITEGFAGAVIADTLFTTSGGSTTLTGPNRVATYSGLSGGDLTLNNIVALDVTGLEAGGHASLTNFGDVTLSGAWTSPSASITANGFGASISETAAGFIHTGSLTTFSEGATSLTGANQVQSFNGFTFFGGDLSLNNTGALNVTSLSGGNVAVTNAGAVTVSGFWNSMGTTAITTTSAGSDLSVSNTVTSQGGMTINVDGALTVAASGMQVIPPPPPGLPPMPPMPSSPQVASLYSSGGQTITAKSMLVSAHDGALAMVNNQFAGGQTITVLGGGIDVRTSGGTPSGSGSSNAQITNFGPGSQSITVSGPAGLKVGADGGFASITNNTGSSQAIQVTGGTGVDVHAASGFALISNAIGAQNITVSGGKGIDVTSTGGTASIQAGGATQTVLVTNADHLAVNGIAGQASISSFGGGMQTLSITGQGANALTVGSQGAMGTSFIGGFGQVIAAGVPGEQGSIRITGTNAPDRFAGITNNSGQGIVPREQNISVAGTLAVTGGSAAGQFIPPAPRPPVLTTSNAGIFNNANASQIINAGGIEVRGGASGLNNGAFISSGAGGNQTITVNGGVISIAGGDAGSNNRAGITSTGNQTINGNPDILLAGGAGGTANNAFIQATGSNSLQAIDARNVQLRAGTGIDASSTVNAARQVISTSGDVSLVGSGGAGTLNGVRIGGLGQTLASTNLTLDVGGNLLLHGGTASGVSLGSSAASTQSNNITIRAAGNVTLESEGAGARIGTSGQVPVTSGNIAVTAGGSLQLSKGAIRTLDNVKLDAADISQEPSGLIIAGTLNTTTSGDTTLIGQNEVKFFNAASAGGNVSLANIGALDVTGMSVFGDATINNIGNVTVSGPWSAGGTSQISAQSDIVLASLLTSPNVVLQASGMITEFGQNGVGAVVANTLTTVSGGSTFFSGENRVANYSGTSAGDLFFFNRGDLDVSGLNASMASLSNNGAVTISGPWITTGQTNITVSGPGASLSETAGGFIQATGFNGLSADGSVNLNGPNRISGNLFGHSMQGDYKLTNAGDLSFGAFAVFGDVDLVNAGALNVTSLSGRNVAVTNAGAMSVSGSWNSMGTTAMTTTGAGSDLTVNNMVTSQGGMTINVDGAVTVAASGVQVMPPAPGLPPFVITQFASLNSSGGQDINAKAVHVSAHDGAIASISNQGSGNQTITVSGGGIDIRASGGLPSGPGSSSAQIGNSGTGSQTITVSGGSGIDIQSTGGFASIVQAAPGGAQSILVTDADHINLNGSLGSALISANGGVQTISITGSGTNAITLGSSTARGFSQVAAGSTQKLTAGNQGELGSITIVGAAANNAGAGIVTNPSADGAQQIATSGTLSIVGGSAPSQSGNFPAGISHNGSGQQTVKAGSLELRAGTSGAGNAVFISVPGGGNLAKAGHQLIDVTGDIIIEAGAGGDAGISGGLPGQRQTIYARNIELSNAVGGNNSFASIRGGTQEIHATGDVRLTARATNGADGGVRIGSRTPNPTDLKLYVDGDLILTGGTAPDNNANIGSSGSVNASNRIFIDAGGSVILNSGSGSGARIGSGNTLGGGSIEIHAGRNIELNGTTWATSIRTLGAVTLHAAAISEASNGGIVADTLSTRTSGNALLTGPNRVASFNAFATYGDAALNNTGTLNVTGLTAFNAALTNQGDVSVSGAWNSFGGSAITTTGAGSDLTVTSSVTSNGAMNVNVAGDVAVTAAPAQSAMLRSSGGQSINARSLAVTSNGGLASVSNFGPSAQAIELSSGAGLDVQTLAPGGFADVSASGGNQTINVLNGDHINVNGAGGFAVISNFGGTQSLSITGTGANAITLGRPAALGGSQIFGGVQHVKAGSDGESGSIDIVGADANFTFTGISSGQVIGGAQTVSTSGALRITGGNAPGQPASGFSTGLFHNGSGVQKVSAAELQLQGGATGVNNTAIIISSGGAGTIAAGNQVIDVTGRVALMGGSAGSNNSAIIVSFADQTLKAASVDVAGGVAGVNNGAFINVAGSGLSAGNQLMTLSGDLGIAGGAGGSAGLTGLANRQQTIFADDIRLTNSAAGGFNSVGFIQGGHQEIHATGDVTLTARASGGDLPGVRIGGNGGANASATDLKLFVGGDLVLAGGTAANNGVGIGSTAASGAPPLENNIVIQADGSVILNSGVAGSGARIGSPQAGTGPGNVTISAGGDIVLNGVDEFATIRSLGTVTLDAARITEAVKGRVIAGTLNTTTTGNTSLTGPNQISSLNATSTSGNVSLNNTGVLDVTGMAVSGDVTINNIGNVTLSGPWLAGGTSAITVGSDIVLNSAMVSGEVVLTANDGAILQAPTGSITADTLTTFSSAETHLGGSNDVDVLNANSSGGLTFKNASGTLTLGNIETNGAGFTLSQAGDVTVSNMLAFNTVNWDVTGSLRLLGGSTPGSSAQIGANGLIDITVGGDLQIAGGSGQGAFAQIYGYSDINLTVGGFLTLNAGSGQGAWARVQTASRDHVTSVYFPNLSSGGYFVNGIEGEVRDGFTGFLSGTGAAALGHQLVTTYGEQ